MAGKKKKSISSKNLWPEQIQKALPALPQKAGVYEMLDRKNETLYVGKAKNLRQRVQSYFRPAASLSARIEKMLERTQHISWTEVSSEVEALILETNLIKEKRPKFNILMRDDKNLAYFCITMAEDFPRILFTRRIVKDGSMYIGPKTSSAAVRKTIDLLQDILQFRSTNLIITEKTPGVVAVQNPSNIKYPCLNFHIGKCQAPCIGNIPKAEYRRKIEKAVRFLRGHTAEVRKDLETRMQAAAANREFEKAAHLRDLTFAVQSISEKQVVAAPDEFSADVIGSVIKFHTAFFHLFQIREGKVINSETFSLPLQNAADLSESLLAFLREHAVQAADFPKHLVLQREIFPEEERAVWAEFFTREWGQKVSIDLPQKGKRRKLLQLAEKNALGYALRNAASFIKQEEEKEAVLERLQQKLNMKGLPQRIECFDISHLGGTETVAAMAVALDGVPEPAHYRRFQLRQIGHGEIDDYKSMQEVLLRRLRHLREDPEINWKQQKISFGKAVQEEAATILKILEKNKETLGKEDFKYRDFCVARKDGEIIAFARLLETEGIREIKSVWVATKWRGRKLGQAVIQKLLARVKKGKVYLVCGKVTLREYYEELGFRIVETPPAVLEQKMKRFFAAHPDAPPALVMMWNAAEQKQDPSFRSFPDLIVIDGGKGQLSSASKILQQFPFAGKITLCALAKKHEEIYIPAQSTPLAIPKNTPENQLLQRLRDEAHRFAVSYHKKLHQKNQHQSALDEIPGIGAKMKKKLLQQFGSVAGIRAAADAELEKTVGTKLLQTLRRQL